MNLHITIYKKKKEGYPCDLKNYLLINARNVIRIREYDEKFPRPPRRVERFTMHCGTFSRWRPKQIVSGRNGSQNRRFNSGFIHQLWISFKHRKGQMVFLQFCKFFFPKSRKTALFLRWLYRRKFNVFTCAEHSARWQ